MFDISTAIRDANPLVARDRIKHDQHESQDSPSSAAFSSILTHPRQKLTAQFKRAITMIKQRGDDSTNNFVSSSSSQPSRLADQHFENNNLTSLIEETKINEEENVLVSPSASMFTSKSTSFLQSKPVASRSCLTETSIRAEHPTSLLTNSTIVTIDAPTSRTHRQNSPSIRTVKQSLQQIHSSILQSIHQSTGSPATSGPSNTLGSTPMSVASSTGEVTILETIL